MYFVVLLYSLAVWRMVPDFRWALSDQKGMSYLAKKKSLTKRAYTEIINSTKKCKVALLLSKADLAEVPRHSPFPPFFVNRSFAILMNIDPMVVVGHGLSTTAHAWKTLILRQRACCPHHGGLPTRSVRSKLSRGGK